MPTLRAAVEAALRVLARQDLSKVGEFLEASENPTDCLAAIEGFTVEDFDGLEDITVTLTEEVDATRFRLHYYFDIPTLIWTIEMDGEFARKNEDLLNEHFLNLERGDPVTMEIIQRRYFRGSAIFDRDSEVITDATITLSAIKPRRRTQPPHPN